MRGDRCRFEASPTARSIPRRLAQVARSDRAGPVAADGSAAAVATRSPPCATGHFQPQAADAEQLSVGVVLDKYGGSRRVTRLSNVSW
jgi:hypothetical protein